jgi:hypothetical protein
VFEDEDSFGLNASRISITLTHTRGGIGNIVFMCHPKSIPDYFQLKSRRKVCVSDLEIHHFEKFSFVYDFV